MAGWAENADLAACFLSPVTCPRRVDNNALIHFDKCSVVKITLLTKTLLSMSPATDSTHFSVEHADFHSIDHLKFVFNQADKRLDDSHKTFDATTTKTITLITLAVALLSGMAAYFFANNDFSGSFSPKLGTVLILCAYTYYILAVLIRNILPHNYQPSGSLPSLLLTKSPFDEQTKENEELHLKDVYYSELLNYDFRIKHNFSINAPRLKRIGLAIWLFAGFPLLGLLLYGVISALSA